MTDEPFSTAASGTASLAERLFAGSGEMAERIRTTDWSQTPLGPVDSWPHSLRTAVSICLGSRHPIVLWWGPQRWMFYNDSYRPMLGETKHPQFLGQGGRECWAEIWHVIGPMMDHVIATGEATWSEDLFLLMLRSGYLEETYFTFSYSPIRDDAGQPSGIFNACTESTARVLGVRRMQTLRELSVGARTASNAGRLCAEVLARNPRDIPFALIYLVDAAEKQLQLIGHAGLAPGSPASPVRAELQDDATGWPLARIVTHDRAELIQDLRERFTCLPKEPWDEAAHQAMLLPLHRAGGEQVTGVLVLGINPRRAFDEDFRVFCELVAGHVATSVSNAQAYESERERAEKLAELDRVKTAFFSNVSHEFRTPLTLILGPLEDALGDASRALQGGALESVHRNAVRMLRLVNSLLDFSRVEAGRVGATFEPTDLSVFTAGLAGSFQSLLESAHLTLVVDCPELPAPVYVDRAQWEKIVLNLISNAFKFTFEGEIAVRLRAIGAGVELSVSDTGTGIAASELPKIFDRFHRVPGARGRSYEGSGIGLALVQELVKQHGGSVTVESTFGKGSKFCVSIPYGSAHLPKGQIASDARSLPADVTPYLLEVSQWLATNSTTPAVLEKDASARDVASKARILVADDNPDMREYLVRLLRPRWNVEAFEDGQAALEAALANPPDMVLSDVMMPRMDGVALLRALRADQRTAIIPIVLLSARAGEEAVLGGLETGADDYLIKPFSARELIGRVNTHLEMARARRAATEAAKELAETRAALLADVERKNQELEAFSYSVSHDLRAPLRSVGGFSDALLEDHAERLDATGRDYLQRIRAAAVRMGALIDDLLALSRVERAAIQRERVDLSRLAKHIASVLDETHPTHRVELVVADSLEAEADPRLIEIVLVNLLGNAWKFTRYAPKPHVELSVLDDEPTRVFCVSDNGAGFDETYAAQLFTPFRRLHSQDEFPGTGIGLATVKRIIERHGGRVWARAVPNAGATIYFTLPAPNREQRSATRA